jgi:K+-sensing histidine kinase KdpD
MKMIQHTPSFLYDWIFSRISGDPEYWWIPFVRGDESILGGIVLGCASKYRDTKYDAEFIQQRMYRLNELSQKMATKYSELEALEREKQKTLELKRSQRQLLETNLALESTLLGLTHVIGRPLFMVQGALSNVRDLKGRNLDYQTEKLIDEQVKTGILVAEQAELLNRGLMRIFSADLGSKSMFAPKRPKEIDVKSELEKLCSVMQCLSRKSNLGFRFFQESPMITMDLDSFLYVFYVLIDNAIKYSDPGRTIELICDNEPSLQTYAIKVKSYGLLIDDPSVVFQKFGRGRYAWRYDDTGAGLGCWSAREHMRRQGGDITLETNGNLSVFIVHPPSQAVSLRS